MKRRRSILGPILLITIGVLFALEYIWGKWSFWGETWPVILVVIGLVKLFERMVWEDHGSYYDGRQWGSGAPAGTTAYPTGYPTGYSDAVPPPPAGTSQSAPPPPPAAASSTTPEYPAYPTYPTSSGDPGDGHAS